MLGIDATTGGPGEQLCFIRVVQVACEHGLFLSSRHWRLGFLSSLALESIGLLSTAEESVLQNVLLAFPVSLVRNACSKLRDFLLPRLGLHQTSQTRELMTSCIIVSLGWSSGLKSFVFPVHSCGGHERGTVSGPRGLAQGPCADCAGGQGRAAGATFGNVISRVFVAPHCTRAYKSHGCLDLQCCVASSRNCCHRCSWKKSRGWVGCWVMQRQDVDRCSDSWLLYGQIM